MKSQGERRGISRAIARLTLIALTVCTAQASTTGILRAEEPSLELDAQGRLVLHSLPPVLDEAEVAPHLTRGLTTTFLFRVDPKGLRVKKKEPGTPRAARVEIRYELWDEVFHVATAAADGKVERRTLDSLGELASWWEGLRLVVAGEFRQRSQPRPAGEARVSLDVIPFSRAEQRDTQRWFSETLDDAGRAATEGVAESADHTTDTLGRTFNLLMATSIQRQALASYHWDVPIVAGDSIAGGL